MKTFEEVSSWITGAAAQFGDPAAPIGLLFFRWQDELNIQAAAGELVCGLRDGELIVILGSGLEIPLEVELGTMRFEAGELAAFAAERVKPGLWALMPSFNAPGLIHAFVVLYDVPDPAPWERRIVVATRIEVPA